MQLQGLMFMARMLSLVVLPENLYIVLNILEVGTAMHGIIYAPNHPP